MMNYVGSISIIDRGDAPAKAIIEKNTRSLAQRVADETKEELDKVMDRVDNIYVSYEMSTQTMFENPRGSPNVEYIEDIKELEEIIKDTVKKKKYQQQVTIFIVGFQDICSQKMQLLQQVNQFFLDNSKLDEEELLENKPDIDLEEASTKVNESLSTAEELTKKLSDLNQDIIEWLVNYANNKASNNAKIQGGKKRLEKSLEETKNQLNDLSGKLLTLQTELEEKDEKFQQVVKQLDAKTQEALRYKTAAEVAKKSAEKNQEKLAKLQEEVDSKKMAVSEAEREMEKLHKDQLTSLQKVHQQEIEELKKEHMEEVVRLTGKSVGDISVDDDTAKQESRPSTKETKSSKKSEKLVKTPAKSPNRLAKEKLTGRKDYADASMQDEGGDVSKASVDKTNESNRQATRQSKNLEPVVESGTGQEFPAYELDDEESWSGVPAGQLTERFAQYRQLSLAKIHDLEEQLNVTLTKTHRKVNSLKSQFNEHKSKWESERKILIEQVEQAQKLQTDAEKEADAAMTQLEEFINEQEKLEDEEETKRQELIKTMSRPGTVHKQLTPAPAEKKTDPVSPEVEKTEEGQGERIHSENSEQELKNLMQQTDDAKAQEKVARQSGGAISAPPAVEPGEKTKPPIEREPITGSTEEEVRAASAKSRASLRNQFKSRLDETRIAAEERRTKSPIVPIVAQKSLEDLVLEDDEDDVDLPIPDDLKEGLYREDTLEAGTSPPPGPKPSIRTSVMSKQSLSLAEHPVVMDFLRAYKGIHNFKDAMGRILEDKDQMSASHVLSELDVLEFDRNEKVLPQIASMTENIYYVLNEVSQVVNSVIQNDRGPVVSSLMMGMSRDQTQRTLNREKTAATADAIPNTRGSQRSVASKVESVVSDKHYKELQDQYEKFNFDVKITPKYSSEGQNQMSDEAKKYEEQQKHNVVVMMEMQDTINQLQRELSNLGKQAKRPQSDGVSTVAPSQNGEAAIMFTRLDSERNAKIMKKAVNEDKLDANKYKEAMVQMDEYVTLPGKRLAHLVRKYVHHCRMKEIEDNVQKSNSLNENVFEILDKMESLQNQRARRWADRMDEMGMERLRLANMLMDTLDGIEQESGIFLIKPMYSYRGRELKDRFPAGKISRPFRPQRTVSPQRDVQSAYAPAPTPASNMRSVVRQQDKENIPTYAQQHDAGAPRYDPTRPLEGDATGLMGSSINYQGSQPRATWNMADSTPKGDAFLQGNTPRILELDINRMMIGQNTISAQIGPQLLSNDRLVNAANNNLRSYMTVNRPTGPVSDRPLSGSRRITSPVQSPSPTNPSASNKRVRMSSDVEVPTVMATPTPLPPIGSAQGRPRSGKGRLSPTRIPSGSEIPPSPPGSSLRQSPPNINDDDRNSPIK